jgi:predicted porin
MLLFFFRSKRTRRKVMNVARSNHFRRFEWNKMKFKYFAVLFSAFSSGLVQAEPSVVVYGMIDLGARYSSGLSLSATSSPATNASNTESLASGVDRSGRFGLAGSEDLGAGYKSVFTLESDLYANTGNVNVNTGAGKDASSANTNKLFERQALVGLVAPFGSVLLGRQQNVLRDIIDDIDAVDGRFSSFNPNLQYTALNSSGLVASSATYYGTGNPGNDSMMRQDNAVKFIHQSGPVSSTVLHSFGGVSGSTASGASTQASLAYRQGGLFLAGAYQTMNNDNDTLKLNAYAIGGRYVINDWQIRVSYGSNTADRTTTTKIKTDIYAIGTTYSATPALDLTLGYYKVNRTWSADIKPNAAIDRVIGFAEYKLSKRSLVFLEIDRNRWGGDSTQFQGNALNKPTTTGLTLGVDHRF